MSGQLNEKKFPRLSCALAIEAFCVALLLAFRSAVVPPSFRCFVVAVWPFSRHWLLGIPQYEFPAKSNGEQTRLIFSRDYIYVP